MTEQFPRPNVVELFVIFNKITLVSFGGGLTALARRTLVEEKRWLTDEEFLSAYALARVMPGANQANFAIYVGSRFAGVPGAVAALLGLTLLPFSIVLGLGIVYFGNSAVPALQNVLGGVTAAAVGLAISMGLKTGEKFRTQPSALAFIAAAFVGSVFLKVPLLGVLAVLAPVAFVLEWRRIKATAGKDR